MRKNNIYEDRGDVTAIIIYKKNVRHESLIETADLQLVKDINYSFSIDQKGYVQYGGISNKGRLHRAIMGCSDPAQYIDHINRNTLDNRRSNLRYATQSENLQNKSMQRNNTSGVSGVDFVKKCGLWRARIKIKGREICVGFYRTLELASNARAAAVVAHYPFAGVNIEVYREAN